MFDADYWKEIFHTLGCNKTRTLLTAFGVFWGLFMLTLLTGAGNALRNGAMKDFDGYAKNGAYLWSQPTGKPCGGYSRGREWHITLQDVAVLKHKLAELKSIAPRLHAGSGAKNVARGARSASFTVVGDVPSWRDIESMKILKGRFINGLDIREKRKVCVIGKRVAEVLFLPGEEPIGKKVKVFGGYFRVVGVVAPVSAQDRQKSRTVHLPFATLGGLLNLGDDIHYMGVTAADGVSVATLEERIIAILKERHSIAPDDAQAVGHVNIERQYRKMTSLFFGISALSWAVGLGTLAAGVIGICNIMLLVIRERTREIGIKRALGATPLQIRLQIVCESALLTCVSGYAGLSAGVVILEAVNRVLKKASVVGEGSMFLNPSISLDAALGALAVLVVAGILAGLLPAQRAVRIKPVEAIQDE
ncbi:ABC transporter permease [Desulfoluna spongiiphila]|uniref:ABC transporter permease n=1 Tax=Desulfoluna spongiiphila TaxID=419481 RepID=UPI00125AA171|nr:ABC transporter permease [Desulfoluna spongiiphila]VVS91945.1 abc transporter permease protein domain [Desulfoluna spongiiphila]